jgi:hypothetical protein
MLFLIKNIPVPFCAGFVRLKMDEKVPSFIKGIVSQKFHMLLLLPLDKYFLHLFYFIRFLKYHRFHVEFSNIKRSAGVFY